MDNTENQQIALVDTEDNIIGYEDKNIVHQKGLLHRAFSVFIFNRKGEMLIQQRAKTKYHSPLLWTNACCSHLIKGSTMEKSLHKRLQFEMGFDTNVEYKFKFTYKIKFANGLTEYETDHVYFGNWDGNIILNPEEATRCKWVNVSDLKNDIKQNRHKYTYWFLYIMDNFDIIHNG